MSNYCTASEVQGLAGYPIAFNDLGTGAGSSKPTLTQVNSNIAAITNELDLYLGRIGINSQPTDARILGKLKVICMYGSAALSGFGSLNQATADGKPKTYWDIYREYLKELLENPELYGVVSGVTTANCGFNEEHTEAENKTRMMQQDWKC
jgi:hypothetical protein